MGTDWDCVMVEDALFIALPCAEYWSRQRSSSPVPALPDAADLGRGLNGRVAGDDRRVKTVRLDGIKNVPYWGGETTAISELPVLRMRVQAIQF
jgi:hypothetical protein